MFIWNPFRSKYSLRYFFRIYCSFFRHFKQEFTTTVLIYPVYYVATLNTDVRYNKMEVNDSDKNNLIT
jgi:hypothetical protein